MVYRISVTRSNGKSASSKIITNALLKMLFSEQHENSRKRKILSQRVNCN